MVVLNGTDRCDNAKKNEAREWNERSRWTVTRDLNVPSGTPSASG